MRLTTFVKLSADCSVPSSPFDNPVSYLWCLKCLPLGKGRVHFTWELYLLLSGRQRRVRASSSHLLHHNCLEFKIIAVPGLSWWSREESPPASAGDARDVCLIRGSGRSPGEGNGNPLPSCLENSIDRGAWQATALGVAKTRI